MSRTADLVVARDADLDGRWEIAAQLRDVDCFWIGPRPRMIQLRPMRFVLDTGPDAYDDEDWEPDPPDVQRRRHLARWKAIDWLAWREPAPPTQLASMDFIMRQLYPPSAISSLSMRTSSRFDWSYLRMDDGYP